MRNCAEINFGALPVTASARWRGAPRLDATAFHCICSIAWSSTHRRDIGPELHLLDGAKVTKPHGSGTTQVSPAPFINCARGPDAREALVAKSAREARNQPRTPKAKKVRGPVKGTPGGRKWRAWGSRHVGVRVRRTVFAEDSSALGTADGTVVSWVDEGATSRRLRRPGRWRVVYDEGGLPVTKI